MGPSRRGGLLASALALLAVVAVACGGDRDEEAGRATVAPGDATPAAGARPSGDQVLRLNLGGEPDTLDPRKASFSTEITVINQLWRGLFGFDKELNLMPEVAAEIPTRENSGISADGTKYTFKLKPNQTFSRRPRGWLEPRCERCDRFCSQCCGPDGCGVVGD